MKRINAVSRQPGNEPAEGAFSSVLVVFALTLVVLFCQACSGGGGDTGPGSAPGSQPASSITVIPSASSIEVGHTRSYSAVVKDANGNILNGAVVEWSSSDPAVATIDNSGVAQGVSAGTTIIGASSDGVTSQLVSLSVTTGPVLALAPLPPWLIYCDTEPCASIDPVVLRVCPVGNADCTTARSTTIVAQVDDRPVSGIFFTLSTPIDTTLDLLSGNGNVNSSQVSAYRAPRVILGSDSDVLVSYYDVTPVWGGTTALNFTSTLSTSALLDIVFYEHPSYDTGAVATELQTRGQAVIAAERAMTGLTSEHVTAFFMPTELAAVQGEGTFSYGNGTVTINYGNPAFIAANGGIANSAIPRFAHEYAHELFNEIRPELAGDPSCFNEGVADAVAYVSGFLPEGDFGPVGLQGDDFDSSCAALDEAHDVGNCYFWHVKKAGMLTQAFLNGIFHPQRAYRFDSCSQNTRDTGNNILVYFTEAAGGADMVPVLDSMHIPHAASYEAAKLELVP